MNWFGPQGDCGCCEKGQCDPVGVATDNYGTVNPRWLSSFAPWAFIDTAKPGARFIKTNTNPGSTTFFSLSRCQFLPTDRSHFTFSLKSKILVDPVITDSTAFKPAATSRLSIQPQYNLGAPNAFGALPINIRANASAGGGVFDSYITEWPGGGGGILSETPSSGDVVEIFLEVTFDSSPNDYLFDLEFFINSSSVDSGSYVQTIAPSRHFASGQSMSVTPSAGFGVNEVSSWNQDFRTELIDLS